MQILAQHGPKPGDRISAALADGLLDGVIYGARDIAPSRLLEKCREQADGHPASLRLFDPQYYACLFASEPGVRLGALNGDEAYPYFAGRRRRDLEQENRVVADLEACLAYQKTLPVTAFISPNIVVRRSLDSVEGTIAKDFLRHAGLTHAQLHDPRPVFATLALSIDALRDRIELQNFLQEVTELGNPPAGFYLLVEHPDHDIPPTLEEPDVLSRWMLINRVLSVSGYQVINGYADVLTPYLGAAGATAVASGWFNTLKVFSLKKFAPAAGIARQPVPRYTSAQLLKSIRHTELEQLRTEFPVVLNGGPMDAHYEEDEGSRPSSTGEALQNWECLRRLDRLAMPADAGESLKRIGEALDRAEETYAQIGASGLTLRERSNKEHIQYLREELSSFRELAEI
ncbi:MAG: hypothetical protein HS113_02755 [Verrucomicrobiales bacterium]|nr:hypothetical protein [Verrucomicrobiales bacterium]